MLGRLRGCNGASVVDGDLQRALSQQGHDAVVQLLTCFTLNFAHLWRVKEEQGDEDGTGGVGLDLQEPKERS